MKYIKRREEIHAMELVIDEHTLPALQVFTGDAIVRTGRQHLPTTGPFAYVRAFDADHTTFTVLEGEFIGKRADGTLFRLTRAELDTDYEPVR